MEKTLEHLILILTCIALLWVGIGDIWGHRIHHDFPYSYLATDTFQHQTRAQWIKDAGNYKYEAPYYSGGLTNVIGFYPPIFYHITVILSHLSQQEVYDIIILLPVLFAITGMLLMYSIIRQIHKAYAILCIPFVSFIFYIKETFVAFFWGHWPALSGDLFLFFSTVAVMQYHKKNLWIIIAILMAGTVLTHTAAFVFTILFWILWIIYTHTIEKKFCPTKKDIILTIIVVTILTFSFLNLFRQSWMIIHPFELAPVTDWTGGGGYLQFNNFGIAKYLLLAGIPIGIFLARKQKELLLSLFFLIAGLTNYIGFTIRAFNLRFFWPITLAPLFALPIFLTIKKTGTKTFMISVIIAIILFSVITNANYKRAIDQSGFMNQYIWENFMWLKTNTPANATVYFGYGDLYDQDAGLANAQRVFTRTEAEHFVQYYKNKTISRYILTKLFTEGGAGLPYKVAPFKYELYINQNKSWTQNNIIRDICNYDYYLFDTGGQYPDLIKYSLSYGETMLKTGNFEIVHQNPWSVILHNKKLGEDCIGR